jgi:5-methylcytosine-specific restriction protein A
MPFAAKTQCKGCGRPVHGRYCDACLQAGKGKEQRATAAQRGYGARWQKTSRAYLQAHPLCVGYPKGVHEKRAVAAECTDHIKAHKGDMKLFWDPSNWQPLCIRCNSLKASTEEGGWGRS